jgi:high-affinity nickel permease
MIAERARRRQLKMGIYYTLGHGAIVMALGLVGIMAGTRLPESFLNVLDTFVGVTLILLGAVVLTSLWKQKSRYPQVWKGTAFLRRCFSLDFLRSVC